MDYLTFTVEQEAIDAQIKIWVNKVKAKALEGVDLVGDGVTHYTDLSALSDAQISQLKIYSKNNGNEGVDPSLAGTTKYADIEKAYGILKWFFPEPATEFMTGVVGYTIEEYNTDWEEPEE